MSSKAEIMNEVCISLKITPDIQDPEADEGNTAVTIRGAYNLSRQTVLRDHPWSFAERNTNLTLVGTARTDWAFQYKYPNDCLKAIEIKKVNRTDKPIPFKVAQYEDADNGKTRVILTDQADAVLIYTGDETDESIFDPQFTKTFIAYLAFRCAGVLTTDKDSRERAFNEYQRAKFEATSSDSNEQVPDDTRDADWITGRY